MHDCKSCHEKKEIPETIPYIVHESEMMRAELREKRMLKTVIAVAAAFIISNLVWIFALIK